MEMWKRARLAWKRRQVGIHVQASNPWQAEYLQIFPVLVSTGRFVRILVSVFFFVLAF